MSECMRMQVPRVGIHIGPVEPETGAEDSMLFNLIPLVAQADVCIRLVIVRVRSTYTIAYLGTLCTGPIPVLSKLGTW